MQLIKGKIGRNQITTDGDHKIKNAVSPLYYNAGNTFARVFLTTLAPGESIHLNFPNMIITDTIPIVFSNDDNVANPKNMLHVYWGVPTCEQ